MRTYEELLREDELSRRRIQTETDTNLFVEASAGSGKTSKLVERMVAMVGAGADIRKICAITFTINASREFYRRFRRRLSELSYSPETPEELRDRYREALENIDLCFLGTIDSFCRMIVSEHPMEAGAPSDMRLVEKDEMKAFYRRELTKAANGEYGSEILELYNRVNALYYRADENILSQMPDFMKTRDTVRIYDPVPDMDIEKSFAGEINYIRRVYEKIDGSPELLNVDRKECIPVRDGISKTRSILNKSWNRNMSEVMQEVKKLKNLRLVCSPEALKLEDAGLFSPRMSGKNVKWYDCTICNPGHVGAALDDLKYSCFMEFMDKFTRKAGENLRKNGEMDFYDYQYCLLQMLREDVKADGKLIRHIRSRHSCFLVDEFQDTNPMQAEMLFYLTAADPVENWRDCIPAPGALFIVGDPKQSIYRFRNADVSSYLNMKSLFKDDAGDAVYLFNNFRSTKCLCRSFNGIYTRLFPNEETADQSTYDPIPVDDAEDEPGTSGMYSYSGSTDAEEDAEKVTEIIRHLVANPEMQIYDRGKNACRQIEFRDIMVITADKKQLATYMSGCAEHGIPVYVEGKTVFAECTAMRMITDVMKALANPADVMSVYGALMNGLFDLDDAMLALYCSGGGKLRLSYTGAEDEDDSPVADALRKLSGLLPLADNASPAAVFSGIIANLPVFERAGTKHLEYVFFAKELLRSRETGGTVTSTADAVKYLEELLSKDSDQERSMNLSENPDRVHFANLHKVKGLEAPVVILANAAVKKNKTVYTRTESRGNRRVSYLFRAKDESYIEFLSTRKYEDKEAEEKISAAAEKDRLLYVAGTRAGNILIAADIHQPAEKQTWGIFLDESVCLGDIFENGGQNMAELPEKEPMDVTAVTAEAERNIVTADREPMQKTYVLKRPSSIRIKSRTEEEEAPEEDAGKTEEPEEKPRTDAALVGTMTHRLMELIMSSRGRMSTDNAAESIVNGYSFAEDKRAEYSACLKEIAAKILNGGYGQSNGTSEDIFAEVMVADEFYCEYPFCYRDGDELYHGIMDLVYRKGEKWYIIDYKTNADPDDLDARYTGQLQAYVTALEKTAGITAEAKTYHIDV